MPEPVTTATTTDITAADAAALQRRGFLRGGALLAAAAGGAVAATAGSVLPASAAGDPYGAVSIPIPPMRVLDTRSEEGREAIVASSASALDSKHRLKEGAWIDVAIASTMEVESLELVAVFVNLKSLASTKGGSLVVAEPDDEKPTGTTVTYTKGTTTTNSAFVGLGVVDDVYVVRIWATSTSHVTLDLTGAEIYGNVLAKTTERGTRQSSVASVLKAVRAAQR